MEAVRATGRCQMPRDVPALHVCDFFNCCDCALALVSRPYPGSGPDWAARCCEVGVVRCSSGRGITETRQSRADSIVEGRQYTRVQTVPVECNTRGLNRKR